MKIVMQFYNETLLLILQRSIVAASLSGLVLKASDTDINQRCFESRHRPTHPDTLCQRCANSSAAFPMTPSIAETDVKLITRNIF